jgi:lipopolysaccharide export system permease protein
MKTYIKFIISFYLKSFFFVTIVIYCLVLVLNLLTEIEFFRDIDVATYFPIYISILNSPSLLFEMFPFIFLVSTQVFFINLFKNQQIQTFKYSGLENFKILRILVLTSFGVGILLITGFYSLSSSFKSIYLEIKNKYTSDDKYLAVVTKNGLWIKDSDDNKTNIINAAKIKSTFLIDATITEFDKNYKVIRHIESPKINILKNNWVIFNANTYIGNQKFNSDIIKFYSNFDYERIQNLFSNLSSLSLLELFDLKQNYKLLNLSTTEVNLQINKIFSYPLYLSLMTIISTVIMFNTKKFNSNTLRISIGLFFSVLIYYINNFFNVMGKTEKLPITISVWVPLLFLAIVCIIFTLRINEK